MEGQALTPIDRITPVRVPDPLDPAAVLDAVRRISHQERRELTVAAERGHRVAGPAAVQGRGGARGGAGRTPEAAQPDVVRA
jgi:hypothetical protein